ncbi:heme-binding protein soul2 [Salminus brasiliensis]|uniref:heme-binding protein soul2 n=1 Tax=Salminus brasiliensis TaxID=930266 RepID=UPI003B836992
MKATFSVALCLLFVVPHPLGECWDAPWFCHGHECPEYSVVKTYDNFEERLYKSSRWITKDIASAQKGDVTDGFWKLYNFLQGENDEKRVVPTTRPGLVSVNEATSKVSVAFYIAPDTVLPKPNDETIREENRPSGTIYIRVFGGVASESDAVENRAKLTDDLKAAGKLFDDTRYEGAGYDSPWNLINRHNEVWIYAA